MGHDVANATMVIKKQNCVNELNSICCQLICRQLICYHLN